MVTIGFIDIYIFLIVYLRTCLFTSILLVCNLKKYIKLDVSKSFWTWIDKTFPHYGNSNYCYILKLFPSKPDEVIICQPSIGNPRHIWSIIRDWPPGPSDWRPTLIDTQSSSSRSRPPPYS